MNESRPIEGMKLGLISALGLLTVSDVIRSGKLLLRTPPEGPMCKHFWNHLFIACTCRELPRFKVYWNAAACTRAQGKSKGTNYNSISMKITFPDGWWLNSSINRTCKWPPSTCWVNKKTDAFWHFRAWRHEATIHAAHISMLLVSTASNCAH